MTGRYFEDFAVGQTFASGTVDVDADRMAAFAAEFDPQPFHLDEAAGQNSIFRGLAASGWHTAALTMKLLTGSELRPAGGIVGAGGEITWPRPTRAGDVLTCSSEILEVRASAKRPDQGLLKVRTTTLNAAGEAVQLLIMNLLVQRRPAPSDPTGEAPHPVPGESR